MNRIEYGYGIEWMMVICVEVTLTADELTEK